MFFLVKDKIQKIKTITLAEVGDVLLVQSPKNRNFRIAVKPFEPVRVSFPRLMSFEKAEQELYKKISWLLKSKAKIKIYEEQINLEKQKNGLTDKKIVEKELRKQAKNYLPGRVEQLARQHNLYYSKLTIRKSKTRWGSCSGRNHISLSLYLMRLPAEIIDYVIMHELTHTREHNHSKNFWNLLEHYLPGAKLLEKKLKNYRIQIY